MDRRLSLARGGLREEIFNLLRGLNPTKNTKTIFGIREPWSVVTWNFFRYKWVKKIGINSGGNIIGINSGCRGTVERGNIIGINSET